MATLTGTKPRNTYKDLLQVSNSNSGIDGTLRSVEDGEGTTGPFKVSTSGVEMSQTLDVNGKELILDADGDTSITADTDDQIDIRIAGADDFAFKANSFEVQTGSKIDLNGTELILDADQDTTIAADTDDQIDIRVGGSDQIKIAAGEVAFNDASADVDFRVESNGNANMLFVDGGNDRVGIGTNSPDSGVLLHTSSSTDGIINLFESTGGESMLKLKGTKTSDATVGTYRVQNGANTLLQILTNRHGADNSSRVVLYTADAGSARETFRLSSREDHYAMYLQHARSSGGYVLNLSLENSAPDGSTNFFLRAADNSATRATIASDGDVLNHDGTFGQISDERIKEGIRDANSQWDDIKAIRVRNFKKKDDIRQYGDAAWEQIGVVSQELEAVSPKLVKNINPEAGDIISDSSFGTLYEDGDDIPDDKKVGDIKEIKDQVKAVKYSILYMKAIKALQEAMARIETLETEVAALKEG